MTDVGGHVANGAADVDGDRDAGSIAVGSTVAVALASGLSAWVLGLPELVYVLAVPIGLFLGTAGAAGFAVGRLVYALGAGGAAAVSMVHAVGDLVLVATAYHVWNGDPVPAIGASAVRRGLVRYLLTAAVAVIGAVGVVSLGMQLLGRTPLAASAPVLLLDRSGPVIVGGAVVWTAVRAVADVEPAVSPPTPPLTFRRRLAVAGLGLGWLAGAVAFSLLRQDLAAVPGAWEDLADHVPAAAIPAIRVAVGRPYHFLQGLGAAVAMATALLVIHGGRPRGGMETDDDETEQ
jgi:hypothetical protein